MITRPRFRILAIAMVLLLSALFVTPALADDAPPPGETPAELAAGAETAVAETSQSAPAAPERASELPPFKDPQWCPSGVVPGSPACSPSYLSLSVLSVDFMTGGFAPSGSGVIWIEDGFHATAGDFYLDGLDSDMAAIVNFSLTLRGGWIGPGTAVDITAPSIIDGDSLTVLNWGGAITLTDITVTNAITGGGPGSSALEVRTTGAITLQRVHADGNDATLNGAHLDNAGGTGAVSIANSTFNDNDGHGLTVISDRAITLTGVDASDNGTDYGALLYNAASPLSAGITLAGLNSFNNNANNGIFASSIGAISIKQLQASLNAVTGAILYNASASGPKPITISGYGLFSGNAGAGLAVGASGPVSLMNLSAVSNSSDGVSIANGTLGTPQAVTLGGFNHFALNSGRGLKVVSAGAVKLSNLVATGNSLYGIEVMNVDAATPQPVTFLGPTVADQNGWTGIYIESGGTVVLGNVNASSNGFQGLYVDNYDTGTPAPPAIAPVVLTGTNVFTNNTRQGLVIDSNGPVTLNNLTVSENGDATFGWGARIFNCGWDGASCTTPALQQNVTLLGTNTFDHNYYRGLEIWSYGAVTLNNVRATRNGVGGSGFADGVVITNSGGTLPKPVLVNGGWFQTNRLSGLHVTSSGAVTLTNMSALDNSGGYGVYVTTDAPGALMAAFTLNGVNSFSNNDENGLFVTADGPIKVNKVTAYENGGDGLKLNNTSAPGTSAPGITALGYLVLSRNTADGSEMDSKGPIVLTNVTSLDNLGAGLDLRNTTAASPKPVTITGTNLFDGNVSHGLLINSIGAVALSNITATNNGLGGAARNGAYIDNCGVSAGACAGPNTAQPGVTITGRNVFNENGLHGLEVWTYGAVSLANISGSNNGYHVLDDDGIGASIENKGGALPKPVSLLGLNAFNGNEYTGLYVSSHGAISVSNLTASENTWHGAILYNYAAPVAAKVTISGYGLFQGNVLGAGLYVSSAGAILASSLHASHNGGTGVELITNGATAPQSVTLTGTNTFNYNGSSSDEGGLKVSADGNITVSNLTANHNHSRGAMLDNYFGSSSSRVTILRFGNFVGNKYGDGLLVQSQGSVLLNRVRADYNGLLVGLGEAGIWILAEGNITLVCSSAAGNLGDGLRVEGATGPSAMLLTLKGFSMIGNGDDTLDPGGYTTLVQSACP